jgi:hypothetical protein
MNYNLIERIQVLDQVALCCDYSGNKAEHDVVSIHVLRYGTLDTHGGRKIWSSQQSLWLLPANPSEGFAVT